MGRAVPPRAGPPGPCLPGAGPATRAAASQAGRARSAGPHLPAAAGDGQPEFVEVPFGHPLWVLYSSGTTGLPKAIMHGHGGIVLEHLKALGLHQDLGPGDVFFWYTTTGWMMWNYLAGGLLAGATVVLYDGSATYPGTDALWRLAAQTGVTYFGTGCALPPRLRQSRAGPGPRPGSVRRPRHRVHRIPAAARGLPLGLLRRQRGRAARLVLRWHRRVHRVRRAHPAAAGAGWPHRGPVPGRQGGSLRRRREAGHGEVGELVITAPMPSMPVGFWNDPGGAKYRASYFAAYPGVWRHGDWITCCRTADA